MVWVNGAALAAAGVTRGTPDPEGGRIGRDEHGEPDGLLFERAQDLIFRAIPPPTEAQAERGRPGGPGGPAPDGRHRRPHPGGGADAARPAGPGAGRDLAPADDGHAGLLTGWTRRWRWGCRAGWGTTGCGSGRSSCSWTAPWARRRRRCWSPSPARSQNRGLLTLGIDEVREALRRAAQGGLACAVHAIGDRANRIVLDAFAATRDAWGPRGLRQRIEHVQVLHPDDLPSLRRAGGGGLGAADPRHPGQGPGRPPVGSQGALRLRLPQPARPRGARWRSARTPRWRRRILWPGCTPPSPGAGRTAIRRRAGTPRSGSPWRRPCAPTPPARRTPPGRKRWRAPWHRGSGPTSPASHGTCCGSRRKRSWRHG